MVEVLDLLVNFFNADNQGLSKELLSNMEQFKIVKKYCKLQTIETTKLIQMYYQELAAKQNSLKTSEHGSIFCRAFYHSKDSTLVVESKIYN
jgi:FtsZ-binding cell division protein ZapB